MNKGKPSIQINEDAKPFSLSLLIFGLPLLFLVLGNFFPFFQHLFEFSTLALATLSCLAFLATSHDVAYRVRAELSESYRPPPAYLDKVKPYYFCTVVMITAGMAMWWFIIPALWLGIWFCLEATIKNLRIIYGLEGKKDDS